MRDESIDIAKGIAIIAVVLGHCTLIPWNPWRCIIYSFHMPLFFIFAGYFYKEKEIKVALSNDFRRLIVPYVIFALIAVFKFTATSLYKFTDSRNNDRCHIHKFDF